MVTRGILGAFAMCVGTEFDDMIIAVKIGVALLDNEMV
jgi:hypothetical protein